MINSGMWDIRANGSTSSPEKTSPGLNVTHGAWYLQALLGHLVALVDGHVRPGRGPLQVQSSALSTCVSVAGSQPASTRKQQGRLVY